MSIDEVFDKIRNNLDNKDIHDYRDLYFAFEKPEESDVSKRIPRVCPGAYFIRRKNGEQELKASDEGAEWMLAVDIMAEMRKSPVYNKKRDNDAMRLGKILTKYNLQKRRFNTGWKYLVKRI